VVAFIDTPETIVGMEVSLIEMVRHCRTGC
jgi:hypothetical protein